MNEFMEFIESFNSFFEDEFEDELMEFMESFNFFELEVSEFKPFLRLPTELRLKIVS